jgi:hypothetical protein
VLAVCGIVAGGGGVGVVEREGLQRGGWLGLEVPG